VGCDSIIPVDRAYKKMGLLEFTGVIEKIEFKLEYVFAEIEPPMTMRFCAIPGLTSIILVSALTQLAAQELESWNDTEVRATITRFVNRVSTEGSGDFVPPDNRIAVFDNDGTLWSEKPFYFQLAFALDRVKAIAPQHPEWNDNPIMKAAIAGDMKTILTGGEHALLEILLATHAGMTTDEFEQIVKDWIASARHPQTGRLYSEMVYQPMLELLDYLRAHGFQTWIVSGGGIEFMRPWSERVYGIPPQHVIGSSIKVQFEMRGDSPVLLRLPEIDFIDDKQGKPVGIHRFIGRRPIAAVGNSDGDLQMLQWTTSGTGPRLGLIIHHTDAKREFAYDRDSAVGRLDKGLTEAADNGWLVVDMANDWSVVYPSLNKDADEHPYFAKGQNKHAEVWSYEGKTGPKFWGQLDPSYKIAETGRRQSPVSLNSQEAEAMELPELNFNYRPEQIVSRNNGHTIQHDELPGSFMYVGDRKFALEQFHVHTPSEHLIDGKQFDMELHFVHKAADGKVAVVAVLVQPDENAKLSIPTYTLPNREGEVVAYQGRRNPADFLPENREYFFYNGSFTTPPCTEGVEWIVMKEPLRISPAVIRHFRSTLSANNRPVQLLYDREILESR